MSAALDGRFRELYTREFDYVWHSLRRLGLPPRELEDATHDVFLVVHNRLDQYDPTRPLRPWLFGIAFRVAADERRRARRAELQANPPELPDAAAGPEQQAVTRALVMQAMDGLDLDQRAVVVMHDAWGHTAPEIAEALETPLNTVYSRLRLAREKLAAALRRMNVVAS